TEVTTTLVRALIFAAKQLCTVHANHLLRVYAKDALKGRVGLYKALIGPYNGNTIRTGGHNRAQLLLISTDPVKELYVLQRSCGDITEVAYGAQLFACERRLALERHNAIEGML